MSRRPVIVEEFDDDTDLPLPSRPLPNTGTRGPLLEEIGSDDDDDDSITSSHEPTAGPATLPQYQPKPSQPSSGVKLTDKLTPNQKTWACIYPIYIDAKRPYGTGLRRLPREKCLWWPLSKDIADAVQKLHLGLVHEIDKAHPRDWENPGRVRVQLKKDGRLMNPAIKTKKALLEAVSSSIQRLKPDNIPKPPYNKPTPATPAPTPVPAKSAKAKGKAPEKAAASPKHQGNRRLPAPPSPNPPLANRVSQYSPAIASGILVDTVKAGMNATEGAAAPGATPGTAGGPGGAGKGKRKVVRVRG